jgi:hypothetical protein
MDTATQIIALLSSLPALAPYAAYLVATCAVLATVLPPPKLPASGWYPVVYGLVNHLALNVGRATNVGAPPAPHGAGSAGGMTGAA